MNTLKSTVLAIVNNPFSEESSSVNAELMKDFKEQLNVIHEKLFQNDDDIESFQVQKPEYNTVEEFIHDIAAKWQEDSEYRKVLGSEATDVILANSVLHYVNYLKSDFNLDPYWKWNLEMWQQFAFDMVSNYGKKIKRAPSSGVSGEDGVHPNKIFVGKESLLG